MIKFLTFLLMFGATQAFASPMVTPQETATTMVEEAATAEFVLDELFHDASLDWGVSTTKLWSEYRTGLLKVEKLGVDPATGHQIYDLVRVKTGGSLVLILDVDSL